MTQVLEKNGQVTHFSQLAAAGKGSGLEWAEALRHEGIGAFEKSGFPSSKQEEWRQTNIARIAQTAWQPATNAEKSPAARAAVDRFTFGKDAVAEVVLINGFWSAANSRVSGLPAGVKVMSLAEAMASEAPAKKWLGKLAVAGAHPFVALNTGFLADGVYIHLPKGASISQPIHLLMVSTAAQEPAASHPRVLVVAEDNAQATIVESYVGPETGIYFTNAVTEIIAGADCRIDHCKLQQESLEAYHVASMQVHLEKSTEFVSHAATLGAKLSRNDLSVRLNGPYANAALNGLVLVKGDQHCDNHTLLEHAAPNCPSYELYKHVLDDKSVAVFKGKIFVHQIAQKTDSKQSSKSLLLSDDALMHSMPALEIYADDVKCTHGSTTGPVDEEAVFYLRSRGVSLEAARHLLTYAFAADVTRRIRVAPVRERLEDFMARQHGLPQDLRINDLGSHDEAVTVM